MFYPGGLAMDVSSMSTTAASHAHGVASLKKATDAERVAGNGAVLLIEAAGEILKATAGNDSNRGQNVEIFA